MRLDSDLSDLLILSVGLRRLMTLAASVNNPSGLGKKVVLYI